jgi:seryl-tRNA synthetase
VEQKDFVPLEDALLALNVERQSLNSELDKLLPKHTRTIKDINRMAYIEQRVKEIGKEAGKIKLELKRKPS